MARQPDHASQTLNSPASPSARHEQTWASLQRRARLRVVLAWLTRLAVLVLLLGALGLLAARTLLLPALGGLRGEIEAAASAELGLPVSIAAIAGEWSGLRPRLRLHDVAINDAEGRAVLQLPEVDATLAWRSLLTWQPEFFQLEIRAPVLATRRDREGRLFVAGVELGRREGGASVLDWLLAQRQVVIRDARVSWEDALREAPPLVLEQVEFRLDRRSMPARFGLRAHPPPALASALEVRGEVHQLERAAALGATGRLYLELVRADLGGWQPWLDYPVPLSGQGGVRAWIDADAVGGLTLTADLALVDAATRLAPGLPELALARLGGRVIVAGDRTGLKQLSARQLTLHTAAGLSLPATDVALDLRRGEDGQPVGGSLSANRLDFAILAGLAAYLPLDEAVRAGLARFAPQGQVSALQLGWEGEPARPRGWAVAAQFAGMGLVAGEGVPGVGGLSGSIAGDQSRGRFQLAGEAMHLDLPEVFESSRLAFDRLSARGGWHDRDGRLELVLEQAEFTNPDAAGTAVGRYWPQTPGGGEIDLEAQLKRAAGTAVWRYLPKVVNRDTHDWVRDAIRAAEVPEARLRLRGRIADFPFRAGEGEFLVSIQVVGGTLDYAPGWPAIDGIEGEVRFAGPGMRIAAERARISGVQLANVVAEVPDLDQVPSELMTITGQATGATTDFLRFIADSPVSRQIGGFTDGFVAQGNGTLELRLVMPLRNVAATAVTGEYRFTDNRLTLFTGLPALEKAGARVRFTADAVSIADASAQLLGHPLRIAARTEADGGVRFDVAGKLGAAGLRAAYPWPVLARLEGATDWTAVIRTSRNATRVTLESGLGGLGAALPAPFAKAPAENLPFSLTADYPAQGPARVSAQLGKLVRAELQRDTPSWQAVRGGIALGRAAADAVPPSARGVQLAAVLDQLDLDAWLKALEGEQDGARAGADAAEQAGALPLAGASLVTQELLVLGETLRAVELRATSEPDGWKARLVSDMAEGGLEWRPGGGGTLTARLRHLRVGDAGGGGAAPDPGASQASPPRSLPALDVVAERFQLRGLELGKLDLYARNRAGLWQLERLALENPDGRLNASGQWQALLPQRTELEFTLDTPEAGRLLARMGYPGVLRGGAAKLSGRLAWRGAPTRFDPPTLAGNMNLDVAAGQFNKLEPGVGRLLGILSLQSLPRRVTLDFRDVFSEGFAFDRIAGSVGILRGTMQTEDFEIRGPAARVRMSGTVDVVAETQNLRVLIQPTLSESVAIGAAASLLNPAVGVVTYLAQKALSDPIEKLFAYEYAVSGSWSEPQVLKRGNVMLP